MDIIAIGKVAIVIMIVIAAGISLVKQFILPLLKPRKPQ